MCNLSESIAERAEIKGYDKGFNKGEISGIMKTLVTLVKKNRLSIAEVVDDSHKRPDKVIFLNLYQEQKNKESKQMSHSLKAVENLLKENRIKVYSGVHAMQDVADFLNLMNKRKG